jgi:hypothetical protein
MKSRAVALTTPIDNTPVRHIVRTVSAAAFFRGKATDPALAGMFREYLEELLALPEGSCRAVAALKRSYQTRLDAVSIFAQ